MQTDPFAVLPLDKWKWHPSPLAGQIVYVLTCSASGELDLAPKSWVQMAGFNGPLLSLGCSKHHWTHNNIMATGHYTVSFPTVEQTRRAEAIARTPRAERVAASGLTPVPSSTTGIPHLRECPAYCECELYREVVLEGDEVLILGQIRRLAVHTDVIGLGPGEMYSRLAPGFFLEPGVTGTLALED